MSPKRYIIGFSISLASFACLTILLNYLIDPYQIFSSRRIAGLNEYKVDINRHVRISKAFHPKLGNWDTLIVGNSRVEMGLDPRHTCFQKSQMEVYNLGVPGAGVRQQLEYALNLIFQLPIKRVYLSVDFVDFLESGSYDSSQQTLDWSAIPKNPSLGYTLAGTPNPEYRWSSFVDNYRALFSLNSLVSSIKTIALQSPSGADRDENGFNPARDFKKAVEVEGPNALFTQKIKALEERYRKINHGHINKQLISMNLNVLNRFIEITESQDIDLVIFTNPFHQEFWNLLKRHNLYQEHQRWLNELSEKLKSKKSTNLTIWNFSYDSMYIHELLPGRAVKTKPLTWFWEPSHYRKELGDLMLNTMLQKECGTKQEFGIKML